MLAPPRLHCSQQSSHRSPRPPSQGAPGGNSRDNSVRRSLCDYLSAASRYATCLWETPNAEAQSRMRLCAFVQNRHWAGTTGRRRTKSWGPRVLGLPYSLRKPSVAYRKRRCVCGAGRLWRARSIVMLLSGLSNLGRVSTTLSVGRAGAAAASALLFAKSSDPLRRSTP